MSQRGLRNLYRFELRQNYGSMLIWALVLAVGMYFFMSFFPSMSKSDFLDIVNAKISAIPKGMAQAFGIDSALNFQNIIYFFAYCWQFFSVALVVYVINLGSNLISKEHEEKHIDYLATKPISKGEIVTAKVAASVTLTALLTVLLFLVALVLMAVYNPSENLPVVELVRLFFKSFVIYVFFGRMAIWLSLMLKKTSHSNMIALGVFFATYILGVMSKILPSAESLKYFSPYFYFDAVAAPAGFSAAEWWYVAALVGLSILMYVIGLLNYREKDLSW